VSPRRGDSRAASGGRGGRRPDTERAASGALGGVARGGAAPVVAVLERRGRFLTAEPFFARGRRVNVDRPHGARQGELVLVTPVGHGAGHSRPASATSS
jgi:hypothetical protein